MHQMVFINLPVSDLNRSREFFTALGYTFDEKVCQDGTSLGVILGPNMYAMLLDRKFFDSFHDARTAEPGRHEVITCLTAESREQVDTHVEKALAAGATAVRAEEQGDWMFYRSFADPDGHLWEIMWMDDAKATAAGALG
ncbi:VOC family protein [Enemella sp. A6]|uniref:VOC family protein n=1 Tax=Enemella sp. A6 TaxID=3440152 RepID=UPI003EBB970D